MILSDDIVDMKYLGKKQFWLETVSQMWNIQPKKNLKNL